MNDLQPEPTLPNVVGPAPQAIEPTTAAQPLELRGIGRKFGGVIALQDVSLILQAGEVHGIIGPNGAGKTTLFDIVSGLLRPTTGRVLLEGRDVTKLSPVRRARLGIRRTFQRQQPIGWLSVEDNIVAAMDWHGGGGGTIADLVALPSRRHIERAYRARACEMLEICGLTQLASTMAGELTIGQTRMLEFARALVDEPAVLLLDEPTSGLGEAGIEVARRIIEAARSYGTAIGLVEHDVSFVTAMCTRITVLDLGKVIAHGTPAEIIADPIVQQAYLGEIAGVGIAS